MLRALVDALIVFTLIEAAVLALWRQRRGPSFTALAPGLAAGLLLMIAVRLALTPGLEWGLLACAAGSGLCHALDLKRRWQAGEPPR